MWITMAITTAAEFLEQSLTMRFFMTLGTFRDIAVFVRVTEYALQAGMLFGA